MVTLAKKDSAESWRGADCHGLKSKWGIGEMKAVTVDYSLGEFDCGE